MIRVGDNEYQIMEKFQDGHTTAVYKVRDTKTGEIMVAKLATTHGSQVETEVQMRQDVQTSGIIPILADVRGESGRIIFFPYAQGGDLIGRVLDDGPIAERDAKQTFYIIARALHDLHANGIIHGDVKPDNILIMGEKYMGDNVVLSDLGLAKKCPFGELCYSFTGTVEYTAPEMLRGHGYNNKVDTWALGVTMYVVLTGVTPFISEVESQIKREILRGLPNIVCSRWRNISEAGRDLLRKMLRTDVNARMSMAEVMSHKWFDDVRGFFDVQDQEDIL